MTKLILTRPDDWHIHLRDELLLQTTVPHAAQQFQRAIVMPNLKPPVVNVDQASAYRERILAEVPQGLTFEPLMTLYLTDQTTPTIIKMAQESGIVFGCKLYPAGSTTNSENGVTNLQKLDAVLETMQEVDLPLLIHGEVTDHRIDIFDREAVFIETILKPLIKKFPKLRIVLEHITTKDAVEFVKSAPKNIGATITAHHLLINRNDLLAGGIKPHYYCLPIVKRKEHQEALLTAATSGHSKFFIGTDSAPHAREAKETDCGCAGIYTAHAALSFYAEAFESVNALDKLEAFCSFNGPDFYHLPRNLSKVTLVKEEWQMPKSYPFGISEVEPFRSATKTAWKLYPYE